jgi:hypothetical protein
MKNLLLFVLLVFFPVMIYGQWTIANFAEQKTTGAFTSAIDREIQDSLVEIKIYPNPSPGLIYIDGLENRDNELWYLQLADMSGRLIYSVKLNPSENAITLPDVARGVYIIKLSKKNSVFTTRITLY